MRNNGKAIVMNSEKKLVPSLRFPEFEKDGMWGEKCFGDCLDYEQPQQYLVSSDNYKKEGTPVLTAGKTFVLGFTDESYGIYRQLPVIIFDDFTTASRYVNFPFKAKSSAMKMLQNKDGYDLKFMFEALQNYKYEPKEHQRHWISIFQNFKTLVPSYSEQRKIAECLSTIDSYISSINEKVEQLKAHKKSLMQKLFPQKGNTNPEYRFPEFVELGMWTEKTLGDIGDVCMCKRIMKDETNINYSIPFYKIGTFGKKADTYITEEQFNEYKTKYSYPQKGDILFSAAGTIGRYVEFDGKPAYFQDSNIVWIANDETLVCNKFLKYLYSKVQWIIDDGGVVKRLYNDSIKKTSIQIPSMPEQRKIAECLSSIDETIRFYSEKVSQLEQHKKGLMQQLFPKA
jgi:type I restriction enzyme S subunit